VGSVFLLCDFKNVCCTQIIQKGSIFIKCPNESNRSEVLKAGVIAIPGHCMHKDWYCIHTQTLVITGNWHPAQSACSMVLVKVQDFWWDKWQGCTKNGYYS